MNGLQPLQEGLIGMQDNTKGAQWTNRPTMSAHGYGAIVEGANDAVGFQLCQPPMRERSQANDKWVVPAMRAISSSRVAAFSSSIHRRTPRRIRPLRRINLLIGTLVAGIAVEKSAPPDHRLFE
jgi:hypothetical protein